MTAQIIDGKKIAAETRELLAKEVALFHNETGITPHLAAILVGEDPASAVYVRNKERACAKAGMKSTLHKLPSETTEAELLEMIEQFNDDSSVHGILVQLPLPGHIEEQRVLDAVTPLKDVDCFHPENVGLLAQGRPRFQPCTPRGVQVLLEKSGIDVSGKHAVVLGRSEIVGKPMAMLLVQKGPVANATVTICHSRTANLKEVTRQADILVAAIGKPNFVTAEMVKPGAVVMDVGINSVDGKLVGDVDFDQVAPIASSITPVPGGVGPMTIAMLLDNTLTAARIAAKG
ncbi:Tetrahydrofolate dehydrogenase/cyclohydrolase [Polystyrenella longa]|uniref:Bifunctional protein FolD n=1 Tax=Polystyrenella longa TaxID=2528007 RepID=A0A518CSM4_9PLAN|nr:bifunctional methylenetetrahydrofolate dehydrogenase/methenyltetrahydrofolate cyclohydrolase FolD [Polystyrenella longa]QDU82232.1 Tetrahydrofolate dehydrogenase/cyclohydrolase [Polystyrenella longa]